MFTRLFGTRRPSIEKTPDKNADKLDGIAGSLTLSFEDYLAITALVYEWADSYDNKDWTRLSKILAPTLLIDYSIVGHSRIEDMPAKEFLGMMSAPQFLGDPLIRTQHMMGASKYERLSETEVVGHHQIRAAHQRYTGPDKLKVENKGHGHSHIDHWYRRVDGQSLIRHTAQLWAKELFSFALGRVPDVVTSATPVARPRWRGGVEGYHGHDGEFVDHLYDNRTLRAAPQENGGKWWCGPKPYLSHFAKERRYLTGQQQRRQDEPSRRRRGKIRI
ncbi:hypothetical protein MMC19_006956 [Ptychographa xylographoides]|nr:hypothetical protein [Ptychographa xylographoides]